MIQQTKKEVVFIGDPHGNTEELYSIIDRYPNNPIIILGDLEIGFPGVYYKDDLGKNVSFISGNHDNPQEAYYHKNYLGDFGYNFNLNVFYISKAETPNKDSLVKNKTWWPNEELDKYSLLLVFNNYAYVRPDIVVSHEWPTFMCQKFGFEGRSRTSKYLELMIDYHRPKLFVGGHYHRNFDEIIDGCRFVCLDKLEVKSIDLSLYD